MLVIPIIDVPSQTFGITLANQVCQMNVYQKSTGLYCDVSIQNVLIKGGVICEDRNRLIRWPYLGFIGDLMFVDTQGNDDPSFPGLGSRFIFVYLAAGE